MQTERTEMFNELRNVEGGCGALILDNARDLLSILLGKSAEMYAPEQMDAIWLQRPGSLFPECIYVALTWEKVLVRFRHGAPG